jgi:1-acyl-sn-glycerol-3-phosphate acyltransferase
VHDFRPVCDGKFPTGPAVLVANHLSYVDPILIAARTPVAPIAKAEIGRWPLIGACARRLGVTLVDRRDASSRTAALRTSLRALEAGVSILNFPEGTTTEGTTVLPFWRGIFGVARIAGVPIVPIALSYEAKELCWTGGDTFAPHYWKTASRPITYCKVRYCAPIEPGAPGDADDLAVLARTRIAECLGIESHVPTKRFRVPPPRPNAVLSPGDRLAS